MCTNNYNQYIGSYSQKQPDVPVLTCPICHSHLGDETYISKATNQIIGCENCIGTIGYYKLLDKLCL